MNFIDIADHQAGINLDKLFAENPLDGVIIKATEGTFYVNKYYCDPWVQWCRKNGKPWGFYHFLRLDGAKEEANFFVQHCKNYFGEGVPCVDWEDTTVERGTAYLLEFLEEVYRLTGVKPLVYMSLLSALQPNKNGLVAIATKGYKLWLAQYTGLEQYGFRDVPWQSGSYYPWTEITMHQYTEIGRLSGWNMPLDLDKFYGTIDDWDAIACKTSETPPVEQDWKSEAKKHLLDIKAFVEQKIKEIDNL